MPCEAVSRLESEKRSVLLRGTGKLPRVRQAVMKDKSLFPQKRGKRAQDFIMQDINARIIVAVEAAMIKTAGMTF